MDFMSSILFLQRDLLEMLIVILSSGCADIGRTSRQMSLIGFFRPAALQTGEPVLKSITAPNQA